MSLTILDFVVPAFYEVIDSSLSSMVNSISTILTMGVYTLYAMFW